MPNRKERRSLAKKLGLLKRRSKMSLNKYDEEIARAQTAGKEIHRSKTEEMLRAGEQIEVERRIERLAIKPYKSKKSDKDIGNMDS